MPHLPAPHATRTLGRTLCAVGGALAAAVALDAAASAPAAAARPRPAHPARAHATRAGKSDGTHGVGREHAERIGRREGGRRGKADRAHTARAVRRRERAREAARDVAREAPADERAAVPPVAAVPTVPAFSLALSASGASAAGGAGDPIAAALASAPAVAADISAGGDTLAGRSGKLRARFVVASAAVASAASGAARSVASYFPYLRRLFGDSAARVAPGVYDAPGAVAGAAPRPFAFITMLPFSQKVAGRVGTYNMGFWPGETSARGGERYANPAGFIEVTAANQATYVSEHFRLGDFLTHDQQGVWPKYLVLHETLLDKLELVLDDLRAHGYQAERLHVMSGFRTPQYNRGGGDPSGRAELSRHQYGDAADVWVENGSGAMADLNGDGRVDARDAALLAAAAERVEAAHPELTGGVGIYHGTRAHGPFVHIDTRGARARWGHG